MTKLEALDRFCLYHDFANTKVVGETKVQFLNRKEKEWALSCVVQQIINDEEDFKQKAVAAQLVGMDL